MVVYPGFFSLYSTFRISGRGSILIGEIRIHSLVYELKRVTTIKLCEVVSSTFG